MSISLEEFLKDITVLDQKIFLISHYAQRGHLNERTSRGKAINKMLIDYKEYLHTGKNKSILESAVKELYVERSDISSSQTKINSIYSKKTSQKGYGKNSKSPSNDLGLQLQITKQELVPIIKKTQAEQIDFLEKRLNYATQQNDQIMNMLGGISEFMQKQKEDTEKTLSYSEDTSANLKNVAKDTKQIVRTTKKIETDLNKLTVGQSTAMIMAHRFKNLIMWSIVTPTYMMTKFIVWDTYVGSMKDFVKWASHPLWLCFGFFNICVTAGVIVYSYDALTTEDIIDQVNMCNEDYMYRNFCTADEDPDVIYNHNQRELVKYVGNVALVYTKPVFFYLYRAGEIYLSMGKKGWEIMYQNVISQEYIKNLVYYVSGTVKGLSKSVFDTVVDSIVSRFVPEVSVASTVYSTVGGAIEGTKSFFSGWW